MSCLTKSQREYLQKLIAGDDVTDEYSYTYRAVNKHRILKKHQEIYDDLELINKALEVDPELGAGKPPEPSTG